MADTKKVRIFFDMDGVLCKWDETSSVEDTFLPGYFLCREEQGNVKELILMLRSAGFDVAILSAVYTEGTAYKDKEQWLRIHGLSNVPKLFVPYGEDKSAYVDGKSVNILVDDFSQNLHAWEDAGFTGIKFYNGVNRGRTWEGYSLDRRMNAEKMFVIVKSIAEETARKTAA